MKLNNRLLAQMRAATRSMLRRGPAATASAIQQALDNASAVQQAARRMVDPGLAPVLSPEDQLATVDVAKETLQPELPGTFTSGSYANAAGSRDYKLYIPSSYRGGPASLLVMLHGCTQDPDDFARGTQMNVLAEDAGCLVVYPAQSKQANPSLCWNWFDAVNQQRGQGEPSIIAGITREVMARYAVAPDKVFVAGLSAGGAMATIMGTLYPDLYAAVGVHSGLPFASADDLPSALAAMKGDFRRSHAPGRTLPIIVFHGDKDTTVHPANGEELIAQGTHQLGKAMMVEPGQVPDGLTYTRTIHHGDDGKAHAEHWLVHGGGHAWFGGSAHGSYTDARGPDASREMLRFFSTRR